MNEDKKVLVTGASGGIVLCQTGQFVGSIYIKNVQITHAESPVMEVFKDYITNGSKMVEAVQEYLREKGVAALYCLLPWRPYSSVCSWTRVRHSLHTS